MKKITPVFGPQELFNGAANCDEYLVAVQHSVGQKTKVSFYPSLVEAFNYVVDFPPCGVVFHRAAMRKIEEVPEPKRWTIEDQKAGRLPEVGCMVMVTSVDECASVAAINNDAVCVVFYDGEFTTLHKSGISPIETPEEKAERLRNEWINEAINAVRKTDVNGYESIYDALLSGALSVPTKGGE